MILTHMLTEDLSCLVHRFGTTLVDKFLVLEFSKAA